MRGFSQFGAGQGAAYVHDWNAVIDRQMKNEQFDLQAAQLKMQKSEAISNLMLETPALNDRYKDPLKKHYDALASEMGKVFSEYDDPFQSPEGMKRMKDIGIQYQNNDILTKDKELSAEWDAVKQDYKSHLITDEQFNAYKAHYDAYASGKNDIPFVYSRPPQINTSSILSDVATKYKPKIPSGNDFINKYTDVQFNDMTNDIMSNSADREIIKNNMLLERKQLGLDTDFTSGAELEGTMKDYIKNRLIKMYPGSFDVARYNSYMSNNPNDFSGMQDSRFKTAIIRGTDINNQKIVEEISPWKPGDFYPPNIDGGSTEFGFGPKSNPVYSFAVNDKATILGISRINRDDAGDSAVMDIAVNPVNWFNGARAKAEKIFKDANATDEIDISNIIDKSQKELIIDGINKGKNLQQITGNIFMSDESGGIKAENFTINPTDLNALVRIDENGKLVAKKDGLAYLLATKNAIRDSKQSLSLYPNILDKVPAGSIIIRGVYKEMEYTVTNINDFNKKSNESREVKEARDNQNKLLGNRRRLGSFESSPDGVNTSKYDIWLNNSNDRIPDFGSSESITVIKNGKEETKKVLEHFTDDFKAFPNAQTDAEKARNNTMKFEFQNEIKRFADETGDANSKKLYLENAIKKLESYKRNLDETKPEIQLKIKETGEKIDWIKELL